MPCALKLINGELTHRSSPRTFNTQVPLYTSHTKKTKLFLTQLHASMLFLLGITESSKWISLLQWSQPIFCKPIKSVIMSLMGLPAMHKHVGWEKASSGMQQIALQIFCFERLTVHIHIMLNSRMLPLHSAMHSHSCSTNLPSAHKIQGS